MREMGQGCQLSAGNSRWVQDAQTDQSGENTGLGTKPHLQSQTAWTQENEFISGAHGFRFNRVALRRSSPLPCPRGRPGGPRAAWL